MNIKKLDEKRRLEFYAVLYFIWDQRKNHHRWLIFKEFSEPPNPDTYCLLNGEKVGIEVTHLFGDGQDAPRLLGKMTTQEQYNQIKENLALFPLNQSIPNTMNRILEDKAKHNYGRKTWLVIRNAFPLWEKDDFEMYLSEIIIPRHHAFEEIWLVCDRFGVSGTLCLYP